jgi:hypothetical protein
MQIERKGKVRRFNFVSIVDCVCRYGTVNGYGEWSPWPGVPYLVPVTEKARAESLWVDLIPFPYTELPSQRNITKMSDIQKVQFMHCVKAWGGFEGGGFRDDEGNEIECTEENKEKVFDIHQPFRTFVLDRLDEMAGTEMTLLKN